MTSIHVRLSDLVFPLAKTVDLMCPPLAHHHMQAAYLGYRIAMEAGLPKAVCGDVAVAGALHDIGAFSMGERLDLLTFEQEEPHAHARAGALLLESFAPLARLAEIVAHHHVPWAGGDGRCFNGEAVSMASHTLHLADRVAVLIDREQPVLEQVKTISERIARRAGSRFAPELVEALQRLASRDIVWLEATNDRIETVFREAIEVNSPVLDLEELRDFARLLCRVIDFKSSFTATHSSGVAAVAVALAQYVGLSPHECALMEVAAYLHDVGKLAIPLEILEKPGRLDEAERAVMRTHVYYSYQILEPIATLEVVTQWSALHQERLNGTGYPFGYTGDDLPLGARIMAVADVFTAITEDRPYRAGMPRDKAETLLQSMARDGELDPRVVDILMGHFDETDGIRAQAQSRATHEYQAFQASLVRSHAE